MADKPDDGCKESNNKLCPGQLGQQEDISLAMMEGSVVERRRDKKEKKNMKYSPGTEEEKRQIIRRKKKVKGLWTGYYGKALVDDDKSI